MNRFFNFYSFIVIFSFNLLSYIIAPTGYIIVFCFGAELWKSLILHGYILWGGMCLAYSIINKIVKKC